MSVRSAASHGPTCCLYVFKLARRVAREMLVLYGSETGNARDVAEGISQRARIEHGWDACALPMDAMAEPQQLAQNALVVYVCSTTGAPQPRPAIKSKCTRVAFWALRSSSFLVCEHCGAGSSPDPGQRMTSSTPPYRHDPSRR